MPEATAGFCGALTMFIRPTGFFFRSRRPNARRKGWRLGHRCALLFIVALAAQGRELTAGNAEAAEPASAALTRLNGIAGIVEDEIRAGNLPGAVILVAVGGKVV